MFKDTLWQGSRQGQGRESWLSMNNVFLFPEGDDEWDFGAGVGEATAPPVKGGGTGGTLR